MELSPALLQHFGNIPDFDLSAYLNLTPNVFPTAIRLHPNKKQNTRLLGDPISYEPYGIILLERPNFGNDPHWHAGAYYVQESASMLSGAVARQILSTMNEPTVLDLCAAPGGKSTHLASILNGNGFLVANDVIQSRLSILKENMKKWGFYNIALTNKDPEFFGKQTPHCFDLIAVDAPCSGEGLFRRDTQSMQEWSEENVSICSARQKRIVHDVWPALKPGGFLIYSTCTFNRNENEDNIAFFASTLGAQIVTNQFREVAEERLNSDHTGFRFTPYSGPNEGFFLAVLQKSNDETESGPKMILPHWNQIKPNQIHSFLKQFPLEKNSIWETPVGLVSAPEAFIPLIHLLKPHSWGGILGQVKGKDFIPEDTSALLDGFQPENPLSLNLEETISFLKGETQLPLTGIHGWKTICYEGNSLGWVKEVGNRMNNYWPKGWRKR